MVHGEEIIPHHQPKAKGKAEAAAQRAQSPAPAAVPGPSVDSRVLAAGSITATSISAGAVIPTGPITAGVLAAGTFKACEIASRACDANSVPALFPGALHADSVTAAWAMRNGLGHLVKPR